MGRKPKTVEDRREQIIDAALRVFAEKGFDRATNRDIAREAGITPGLIYHYFESKEVLLRSAIENRSPLPLMKSIGVDTFTLPPESMLRTLLGQMLGILESERFVALMRVYLPEIIHNRRVAPFAISVIGEATAALERYLAQKIKEGELKNVDPGFTSHYLLGGLMDLVLRRKVLRDPTVVGYTQEQIVEGVLATVARGILP
jgi:AcrR family transcriptional regulator